VVHSRAHKIISHPKPADDNRAALVKVKERLKTFLKYFQKVAKEFLKINEWNFLLTE